MKSKASNTIYSYDGPNVTAKTTTAKVKYNPITKRKVVKIKKTIDRNYNNPQAASFQKSTKKIVTTPKGIKIKYK